MKVFFGIVIFLLVAWTGAVWFFNRNGGEGHLQTTDSLQAKGPLPDSMGRDSLKKDSVNANENKRDTVEKKALPIAEDTIDTGNVRPQEVVLFARTLIGTPYLYASADPNRGFDCSGFITYVFNHFAIAVPRSSIEFTNVGREVSVAGAREGDLILFTGTDSSARFVGHMGIVVSNTDTLRFIHSSSGKAAGVTITPLNRYYQGRYVKTVRVFP